VKKVYYLYATLLIFAILTPLGLLAQGSAWGEWSAKEIEAKIGFVPQGLKQLEGWWKAPIAGYNFSSLSTTFSGKIFSYVLSAAIGAIILILIFKLLSLTSKEK
jgi:uncharacterized membrane protein YeaQ/YmgE (transglycosylase-associated protein family)